jgi:c-di-GMP-binding flagellar brake protein YcgR
VKNWTHWSKATGPVFYLGGEGKEEIMEERRKYPRIGVSFPVECNVLSQRLYFYTVSKDLSLGGIKILSDDFIPKDNIIRVRVNLIDETVSLKARVAWCNSKRVSEKYLIGLEFIEISQENQRNVFRFLNRMCTA